MFFQSSLGAVAYSATISTWQRTSAMCYVLHKGRVHASEHRIRRSGGGNHDRQKQRPAESTGRFLSRGRRTRTLNKGFGDPRVTITPCPYVHQNKNIIQVFPAVVNTKFCEKPRSLFEGKFTESCLTLSGMPASIGLDEALRGRDVLPVIRLEEQTSALFIVTLGGTQVSGFT